MCENFLSEYHHAYSSVISEKGAVDFISVIGTRPQYIKLAAVSREFSTAGIQHGYIDTGQHYDSNLSSSFVDEFSLGSAIANLSVGSGSHASQTARILNGLDEVLQRSKERIVMIVYGDTNSTCAAALFASKNNIPLVHVESGLRSGNKRMPEELNRIIVDHVSDLLFAPTQNALGNLANENLAHRSYFSGDITYDLFCFNNNRGFYNNYTSKEKFYVFTLHRDSNTNNKERLLTIFRSISDLNCKVMLFGHPRLIKIMSEFKIDLPANVELNPPTSHRELLSFVKASEGVITDSGGLQKEAYFSKKLCTTLRTETEWVETLESGWNALVHNMELLPDIVTRDVPSTHEPIFGVGNASRIIVEHLVKEYT
jgi:UDP-N-acetylglucosamine 2-epimerase